MIHDTRCPSGQLEPAGRRKRGRLDRRDAGAMLQQLRGPQDTPQRIRHGMQDRLSRAMSLQGKPRQVEPSRCLVVMLQHPLQMSGGCCDVPLGVGVDAELRKPAGSVRAIRRRQVAVHVPAPRSVGVLDGDDPVGSTAGSF